MNPDDNFEPAGVQRSKYRFRFSLLALFIVVTLICLLLAWPVQSNHVVATALFRVSSRPVTILADESAQRLDEQEYEIFKNSQVALLKSYFVLNAALRKPGIAPLTVLRGEIFEDWLENHLEVEFPEDGEFLSISLHGTEAQSTDLVMLVDAVAQAYADEAVYKERMRQTTARDLLNRGLEELQKDIQSKSEEYLEIARGSGAQNNANPMLRQLTLNHLERIDSELMRLEDEQARQQSGDDSDDSKYLEQRISQLRATQGELEKKLATAGDESAELKAREAELQQLRRVADEVAAKVIRMEIEANAPQRIEQVQKAVPSLDD